MTRIKALGLALIAVFAMSAVVASAASAGTIETEGGTNKKVSASQVEGNHTFTVDGSSVECKVAEFQAVGETANGASSVVVHPVYKECSAFGFLEATVTTTNCNYTISAPGSESPSGSMKWAGSLVLSCTSGTITIQAGTCTATVAGQTVSSGITLENTTVSPMDIMITATNAPVSTTKTADGFLCPFNGTGSTTGTYNGHTTSSGGITIQ